jgi:hypothetical protein
MRYTDERTADDMAVAVTGTTTTYAWQGKSSVKGDAVFRNLENGSVRLKIIK